MWPCQSKTLKPGNNKPFILSMKENPQHSLNHHLLLAAVSLCALKYTAATGRPNPFSPANILVLKQSLEAGGLTVCLPLCLNKMNTYLWIPTTGFGVS
jgi:hypothetical protein